MKFFLAFYDACGELGLYSQQESLVKLIEDFVEQA